MNMLEKVFADMLTKQLGVYVENLVPQSLKLSVWNGDILLTDLQLKADAVYQYDLPLIITRGVIKRIAMKIPWRHLQSEPVIVDVDGVYVCCKPKSAVPWNDEQDKLTMNARKRNAILSYENSKAAQFSAQDQEDEENKRNASFIKYLASVIAVNIQVTVKNIHIRYEDPERRCALGFTLRELNARTTDENFEPKYVKNPGNLLFKKAWLSGLGLYCNVGTGYADLSQLQGEDFVNTMRIAMGEPQKYILQPLKFEARATLQTSTAPSELDFSIPKVQALLTMGDVNMALSHAQYSELLFIVSYISSYKKLEKFRFLRPKERPTKSPRAWWKYAGYAVMFSLRDVRTASSRMDWAVLQNRIRLREQYIMLYKRTRDVPLYPKLDSSEKSRFDQLEDELDVEDILYFRRLADKELEIELQRSAAWNEYVEKKRRRKWFNFLRKKAGADDVTQGDEDVATQGVQGLFTLSPEERTQLYTSVGYKPEDNARTFTDARLPRDWPQLAVTASVNTTTIDLEQAARIRVGETKFVFTQRTAADSYQVDASVASINVADLANPKLVLLREPNANGATSSPGAGKKEPILTLQLITGPQDNSANMVARVAMRPVILTLYAETLRRVMIFFKLPPRLDLNALRSLALEQVYEVSQRLAKDIQRSLAEKRSTLDIGLDIQAPRIIIPAVKGQDALVLDLGHATVASRPVEKTAEHDLFDVAIRDLQLFLMAGKEKVLLLEPMVVDMEVAQAYMPATQPQTRLAVSIAKKIVVRAPPALLERTAACALGVAESLIAASYHSSEPPLIKGWLAFQNSDLCFVIHQDDPRLVGFAESECIHPRAVILLDDPHLWISKSANGFILEDKRVGSRTEFSVPPEESGMIDKWVRTIHGCIVENLQLESHIDNPSNPSNPSTSVPASDLSMNVSAKLETKTKLLPYALQAALHLKEGALIALDPLQFEVGEVRATYDTVAAALSLTVPSVDSQLVQVSNLTVTKTLSSIAATAQAVEVSFDPTLVDPVLNALLAFKMPSVTPVNVTQQLPNETVAPLEFALKLDLFCAKIANLTEARLSAIQVGWGEESKGLSLATCLVTMFDGHVLLKSSMLSALYAKQEVILDAQPFTVDITREYVSAILQFANIYMAKIPRSTSSDQSTTQQSQGFVVDKVQTRIDRVDILLDKTLSCVIQTQGNAIAISVPEIMSTLLIWSLKSQDNLIYLDVLLENLLVTLSKAKIDELMAFGMQWAAIMPKSQSSGPSTMRPRASLRNASISVAEILNLTIAHLSAGFLPSGFDVHLSGINLQDHLGEPVVKIEKQSFLEYSYDEKKVGAKLEKPFLKTDLQFVERVMTLMPNQKSMQQTQAEEALPDVIISDREYVLDQDLTLSMSDRRLVALGAGDLHIDGRGHTIRIQDKAIFIDAGRTVRLENCLVVLEGPNDLREYVEYRDNTAAIRVMGSSRVTHAATQARKEFSNFMLQTIPDVDLSIHDASVNSLLMNIEGHIARHDGGKVAFLTMHIPSVVEAKIEAKYQPNAPIRVIYEVSDVRWDVEKSQILALQELIQHMPKTDQNAARSSGPAQFRLPYIPEVELRGNEVNANIRLLDEGREVFWLRSSSMQIVAGQGRVSVDLPSLAISRGQEEVLAETFIRLRSSLGTTIDATVDVGRLEWTLTNELLRGLPVLGDFAVDNRTGLVVKSQRDKNGLLQLIVGPDVVNEVPPIGSMMRLYELSEGFLLVEYERGRVILNYQPGFTHVVLPRDQQFEYYRKVGSDRAMPEIRVHRTCFVTNYLPTPTEVRFAGGRTAILQPGEQLTVSDEEVEGITVDDKNALVDYSTTDSGAVQASLYAAFLLYNHTTTPLQLRQGSHKLGVVAPGAMVPTPIHRTRNTTLLQSQLKAQLRIVHDGDSGDSKWSENFSLDGYGLIPVETSAVKKAVDGKPKHKERSLLSVVLKGSSFSLTKEIHVYPRYQISNNTDFALTFRQVDSYDPGTVLAPGSFIGLQSVFEKHAPRRLDLCIDFANGTGSGNGLLDLDDLRDDYVLPILRNGETLRMLHVTSDLINNDATVLLQIGTATLRDCPYKVDNQLWRPVTVQQNDLMRPEVIMPFERKWIAGGPKISLDSGRGFKSVNLDSVNKTKEDFRTRIEQGKRTLVVSDKPFVEQESKPVVTVKMELPRVGVSLVHLANAYTNVPSHEVVYFTLQGLKVTGMLTDDTLRVFDLECRKMQCDNMTHGALHPVLLGCGEPAFHVLFVQAAAAGQVTTVPFASLYIAPLTVRVEEGVLSALLQIARPMMQTPSNRPAESTTGQTHPQAAGAEQQVYIDTLWIHPLAVDLSYDASPNPDPSDPIVRKLRTAGFNFLSISRAPLRLNALILRNVLSKPSTVRRRVEAHYRRQALGEIYKVVGGIDVVGAPINLVAGLGGSVWSFFYEPSAALSGQVSAASFAHGFSKGTKKLVGGTVKSVASTAGSITGAVSRGLATATFDDQYIAQRRRMEARHPQSLRQGILYGARAFGSSVASGVRGIVVQPREHGAVKGSLMALIGLAVKPVSGVLDFTHKVTEGMVASVSKKQPALRRVRAPRTFGPNGEVIAYDDHAATGADLLTSVGEGQFASDSWVEYFEMDRRQPSGIMVEQAQKQTETPAETEAADDHNREVVESSDVEESAPAKAPVEKPMLWGSSAAPGGMGADGYASEYALVTDQRVLAVDIDDGYRVVEEIDLSRIENIDIVDIQRDPKRVAKLSKKSKTGSKTMRDTVAIFAVRSKKGEKIKHMAIGFADAAVAEKFISCVSDIVRTRQPPQVV
jgi:hypothetical protein